MNELKPCPFCGGEARLKRINGYYGYTSDAYSVECLCCGATIKKSNGYRDLTNSVISSWNRRAKDDTTRG